MTSQTGLDKVVEAGIQIAADGADFSNIGYANYKAVDATTNPSLVLTAVSQPAYSYLLQDAVHYALEKAPEKEPKEQAEIAMDYLLVQVGIEILHMIPGRVSVSVDPRLANDYEAILHKAYTLIDLFESQSIPRSRVLIKIPATYAGIRAAQTLELGTTTSSPSSSSLTSSNKESIHTNMTLVFGLVQAIACAQAKASVISPFVGRVRDWHIAQQQLSGASPAESSATPSTEQQSLATHPGLILVRRIRSLYSSDGSITTQIMAAGFRHADEVLELAKIKGAGPHIVTLPPKLLHDLRSMRDVGSSIVLRKAPPPPPSLSEDEREGEGKGESEATVPMYIPQPTSSSFKSAEGRFEADLRKEKICLDKVPEGLEKFAEDTGILEEKLKVQLMLARMSSSSPSDAKTPEMPGGWNVRYADVKL